MSRMGGTVQAPALRASCARGAAVSKQALERALTALRQEAVQASAADWRVWVSVAGPWLHMACGGLRIQIHVLRGMRPAQVPCPQPCMPL